MVYARSPFGDFESYRRTYVGLVEGDIQLILQQNRSDFIFYEIPLGIYTTKDISEAVYTKGDPYGTIQSESDDISLKSKFFSLVSD